MTEGVSFRTTIELGGKTATGFAVPDRIVEALGAGKRPAVRVTVGRHTYRTTIASMGGRFLVPLSAENRASAGVAAGDEVDVHMEVDNETRQFVAPPDLADALARDEQAREFFDALAPSHRKEWVRWIQDAKKPETRAPPRCDTRCSPRGQTHALTKWARGRIHLDARPAGTQFGAHPGSAVGEVNIWATPRCTA